MKKRVLSCGLWLMLTGAAFASGADTVSRTRLGLGSGPSIMGEFSLLKDLSVGASLSSPFVFYGGLTHVQYSTYLNYQLLKQKGFYISGILGAYGTYNPADPTQSSYAALQGGAAFAYDLNRQWALRINIVPGMALHIPPTGWTFLSPVGGACVVWRPQPHTELTLGFNGNGDILSAYWLF